MRGAGGLILYEIATPEIGLGYAVRHKRSAMLLSIARPFTCQASLDTQVDAMLSKASEVHTGPSPPC